MPVAIKLAFALRTGHPKDFRHSSVPRIFSRQDAKAQSLGTKSILKKFSLLPWRLCAFAGESSSPHSDLFRAKHARLILTPPPPRSLCHSLPSQRSFVTPSALGQAPRVE